MTLLSFVEEKKVKESLEEGKDRIIKWTSNDGTSQLIAERLITAEQADAIRKNGIGPDNYQIGFSDIRALYGSDGKSKSLKEIKNIIREKS